MYYIVITLIFQQSELFTMAYQSPDEKEIQRNI